MLSQHMLAQYRSMTPRERIAEMRELLRIATHALELLPPAECIRRLAVEDRIRRDSVDALVAGLTAAEDAHRTRHGA
jgi:hypothetical protein